MAWVQVENKSCSTKYAVENVENWIFLEKPHTYIKLNKEEESYLKRQFKDQLLKKYQSSSDNS